LGRVGEEQRKLAGPHAVPGKGRIAALKAELIAVGTELLLGEITDTNATYISQQFAAIGVDLHYRHTVGDNLQRLVGVLRLAMGRSDVVLLCGGLGPTEDDVTREALAVATGRPLRRDERAVEDLKKFFAARGRTPSEANFKQCEAPEGATLLPNTCGTAPGVFLEHQGVWLFAVPGPPPEMREMMRLEVLPRLRDRVRAEGGGILHTRVLRLCDIGESDVATALADIISQQTDPTIALYASPGEVRVRLATKDSDDAAAAARLNALANQIRERTGAHVYGEDEDSMEVAVGKALLAAGATCAVAESCTGGLIASRITDVPGASRYFVAGIVAYDNRIKTSVLGVPPEVIEAHGAVSRECAVAMAEGVRKLSGADYAVATTGIAGPDGGTAEKPVGLVYVAVADAQGNDCVQQLWPSTREQFKQRVSQMALNLLRKRVLAGAGG
jgi:nicotinamide-nucleotide amidase